MDAKPLKKWDWEQAIYTQSACNLSGLARSLRELPDKLAVSGIPADKWARHPIVRLFVSQMVYLSHNKQECDDTPLDASLPDDVKALIEALNVEVDKGWEWSRQHSKGTEGVNTFPGVKRVIRKLCEVTHGSADPFGWRWNHAYYRAHVHADKHPYSNSEPLTSEEATRLLEQYDREEEVRERDEQRLREPVAQ